MKSLALFLGGVALGAIGVWRVFHHVPDFYEEALRQETRVAPAERRQQARRLEQQTRKLVEEIQRAESWSQVFTQSQINSWLAEELPRQFPEVRQSGARDPRVHFVDGAMLVGARIERPEWSGVVSLRLKPFVPERNQIAIEVDSVHAGLLPVPLDDVVHEVSRRLGPTGWSLSRRQIDGRDVLVVELPEANPSAAVLEGIELRSGLVRVFGNRMTGAGGRPLVKTAGKVRHSGVN